jgi:hypothetical protein
MGDIGGQSSGDFLLTQGALRILYSVFKDTIPVLAPDGYTQFNPNVITTVPAAISTTLPANVKRGVLGGSVAFTRPDAGGNTDGGAVLVNAHFVMNARPLGLFINDALGNAYENTPGVASGKCPHLRGGSCGVKLYETAQQTTVGGGNVGDPLVAYANGQFLYASVNGYLTNRWQDSYEYQWITHAGSGSGVAGAAIEPDVTRMGTVLSPPDSHGIEMFVQLRLL